MHHSQMNLTPTISETDCGIGVDTAKLLLQRALENEQHTADGEEPELARKRAIKEFTGAAMHLPPKVVTQCEEIITPAPSKAEARGEVVTVKNLRPNE